MAAPFKLDFARLGRDGGNAPTGSHAASDGIANGASPTAPGVPPMVPPLGPMSRLAFNSQSAVNAAPIAYHRATASGTSPVAGAASGATAPSSDRNSLQPISSERVAVPAVALRNVGPGAYEAAPPSQRGAAAGAAGAHLNSFHSASGFSSGGGGGGAGGGSGSHAPLSLDAAEFLGTAAHDITDIEYLRRQLDHAQKLFIALEKRYEHALQEKDRYLVGLVDELRSAESDMQQQQQQHGFSGNSARGSAGFYGHDASTQTTAVAGLAPLSTIAGWQTTDANKQTQASQQQQQVAQQPQQASFYPTTAHTRFSSGVGATAFGLPATLQSTPAARSARARPSSGAPGSRGYGGISVAAAMAMPAPQYTVRGVFAQPGSAVATIAPGQQQQPRYGVAGAPAARAAPQSSRGARPAHDALFTVGGAGGPLLGPGGSGAPLRSPRGGPTASPGPSHAPPVTGGPSAPQLRPYRPVPVPGLSLQHALQQQSSGGAQ